MFYHGSNHKIEKFTDEFVSGERAIDSDGPGIYFTSSWDDARQFGTTIYTVNLKPRKVIYDKPGNLPQKDLIWLIKNSGDWEIKAQNWAEDPKVGLTEAIKAIYSYNETPFTQLLQVYREFYNDSLKFVRNASQIKYDAIFIEKEWGATHAVVLNPSIIEVVKVEDDKIEEIKLNEIRKVVRKTLQEDYNSTKEIKELANDVLKIASKLSVYFVNQQIKNNEQIEFKPLFLSDAHKQSSSKYKTLKEFISSSNIIISFKKAERGGGDYSWYDEKQFDKTGLRTIRCFYKQELVDDIKRKAQNGELDNSDIYFSLWYKFHSTLEHELQHAYDDYRSNTKAFINKAANSYRQKYSLPSGEEISLEDPIAQNNKNKEYLNLPHEIWARFTQTANELKFSDLDFKKTKSGKEYVHYEMIPIEQVLKEFVREFKGWNILSSDMKRRLLRKVAQFWHKEFENISDKNENEMHSAGLDKADLNEIARDKKPEVKRVFHGTTLKKAESIKSQGLKSTNGYDSAGWYMVSTDFESALFHAYAEPGEKAVVFEFEVPLDNTKWEGYPYFWPPYDRANGSQWFALKQILPKELINKIHYVDYETYLKQKNLKF